MRKTHLKFYHIYIYNSHEKDTLKSFMAFGIVPHGLVFKAVVGVELWSPNNPPSR